MAVRSSVIKDDNFYKRVLNRSLKRFLEDLDPVPILDLFLEREYLDYPQVRDIQEQRLTSEKTREIVKKVSAKGTQGYKTFKKLLKESYQEHLAEYLSKQETDLEKEIKMAEKEKEERDRQARARQPVTPAQTSRGQNRIPSDRELLSISAHIGMNWEMLGPFLGVPTTTIDQIKLDNSTTPMKIYRLLYVWRAMKGLDATVKNLLSSMRKAPRAVNIAWDSVTETVNNYDTMGRTAASDDNIENTTGARPKTTSGTLYETVVTPMQQLNLHSVRNPPSSLMIEKIIEDSFQSGQSQFQPGDNPSLARQPQYQPGNNPSLAAMQGELGRTRRQGEDYSNEYGPDLSGRNTFTENRPDGPSVRNTEQGTYVDETDAARERSVERELNQNLPPPTYPVPKSAGAAKSQPMVNQATDKNNVELGGNVTSEPSRTGYSLETIAKNVEEIKKAVVGETKNNPTQEVTVVKEENRQVKMTADNVDGNTQERERRLGDIFDSEQDMKGRLKVLTDRNVEDLLSSCGDNPDHRGGFGDIYVTKSKIPGIDMRLVVKKVKFDEEAAEQKMRSYTNEKLCARAVHFAIVPLLGIREDPLKKAFYFLSPYMENGDLNHAIEKDTQLMRQRQLPVLGVSRRLKILYQIASAIDFLHTPVKDIRGLILHMDVKTLNIVLDQCWNARLIDFGLAREMKQGFDHTKTTSIQYPSTAGYGKVTNQHILAKHDDYRYFGVVIRELLTGKKPFVEGMPEESLIQQSVKKIRVKLMPMWKILKIKPSVADGLLSLSEKCIKKQMTSEQILSELKGYLAQTNTKRWDCNTGTVKGSEICDMCLQYEAVKEEVLSHSACENHMNVCVSCMRNSYCNPIRCHSCDTVLTPTIGHGWAALLIAGNDLKDSVAKSFKEDVKAIQDVITSKCPLVMGISADHVQIVCPDEPGKPDSMLDKLQNSVTTLQKIDNIQTLLVYFSGHYMPKEGGFELSQSKTGGQPQKTSKSEYLSVEELQSCIALILNRTKSAEEQSSITQRAIVFLDCCCAPAISTPQKTPPGDSMDLQSSSTEDVPAASGDANSQEVKKIENPPKLTIDEKTSIVQINACRPYERYNQSQGGSKFREYLIQGLTRIAIGKPCLLRPEFSCNCSMPGDFVTVGNLNDYISMHMGKNHTSKCVMNNYNVDYLNAKIGYVINFKADLVFTYKLREKEDKKDTVPQTMFFELSQLQSVLFDRYIEKMELDKTSGEEPKLDNTDFNGMLCIEVEKGPKKHQRDRLESLDRIMTAWNAKRELIVTLRTLPELLNGMVGIFMSSGQTVFPILEYLSKSTDVKKDEKDHVTVYMVKLGDNFEKLSDDVSEIEKPESSSMEQFNSHLIEIDDTLEKEIIIGELHIIFPCAISNGQRIHRRDFLCYQLKREQELN